MDFDEILACAAPCPLLVIAPALDRHANSAEVAKAVRRARAVYEASGAGESLKCVTQPDNWNRLTEETVEEVINWLAQQQGR